MTVGISGLHYVALGIGFTCGVQLGSRVLDRSYAYLKAKNGGVGTPEMRSANRLVVVIILICRALTNVSCRRGYIECPYS